MNDILHFWKTSISVSKTKKEKWYSILFITVYVILFLLIFQPFGVNNYDPTHRINLNLVIGCIGYGLIAGSILSINEFIISPYMFKKKNNITAPVRLFFLFITLSFGVYIFYNIIGDFHDWKWLSFLGFIRDVSLMSIVPIGIISIYYNYVKIKNAHEVLLKSPSISTSEMQMIKITSNNNKDTITLRLDSLLYVEAQDNYVDIYYLINNKIEKQLLRATMKALELKLKNMDIVRCHRSYLVNMNMVIKAKGNSNQMKLFLPNVEKAIPVSKLYITYIKEIIATRHK